MPKKTSEVLVAGIDEAGRGSLVGPLVMAGVAMLEKDLDKLKEMGVKDSKLLTPKKRADLEKKVKKIVEKYEIIRISPSEIDKRGEVGTNLNILEAMKIADIINRLNPDVAFIDSPGGKKKFEDHIRRYMDVECELIVEYKADLNYPVVGAASILAKQDRDRAVKKIEKDTGITLGVGYPHDERTINGVKDNLKNGKLDKHIRKSWVTYDNIVNEKEQKKLADW
jgi:ribonuclease HII